MVCVFLIISLILTLILRLSQYSRQILEKHDRHKAPYLWWQLSWCNLTRFLWWDIQSAWCRPHVAIWTMCVDWISVFYPFCSLGQEKFTWGVGTDTFPLTQITIWVKRMYLKVTLVIKFQLKSWRNEFSIILREKLISELDTNTLHFMWLKT